MEQKRALIVVLTAVATLEWDSELREAVGVVEDLSEAATIITQHQKELNRDTDTLETKVDTLQDQLANAQDRIQEFEETLDITQ